MSPEATAYLPGSCVTVHRVSKVSFGDKRMGVAGSLNYDPFCGVLITTNLRFRLQTRLRALIFLKLPHGLEPVPFTKDHGMAWHDDALKSAQTWKCSCYAAVTILVLSIVHRFES